VKIVYDVGGQSFDDTAEVIVLHLGITSGDITLAAGETTQVTCDAVPDPSGSDWVSL